MSQRAQRFVCTFWEDPVPRLSEVSNDGDWSYGIVGKETCPTTGKTHWHGYFELRGRCRRTLETAKAELGTNTTHIEIARGNGKEAANYVRKDGDVVLEWGEMKKGSGYRSDLEDIKNRLKEGEDLLDIAEDHFGDWVRYHKGFIMYKDLLDRRERKSRKGVMPEVIVYVGPSGSGKSYHCFNDPEYQKSGYQYLAQQTGKAYFDGYQGESCIWFDEFSGSTMSFSLFCRVADKYGCRVETKGGSVELKHTKILISSIEWPAVWWEGSARFAKDPTQLYRRITKMVYCRGEDEEPIVLRKEGWTATNIDEYERLTSE